MSKKNSNFAVKNAGVSVTMRNSLHVKDITNCSNPFYNTKIYDKNWY